MWITEQPALDQALCTVFLDAEFGDRAEGCSVPASQPSDGELLENLLRLEIKEAGRI